MSDSRSTPPVSFNQRWLVRLAIVAFIGITASQTGCSILRSFDEAAALTFRDLVWSKRAYNLRYGNCDRAYSDHFENGFCEGYRDVCQGGDGYTPALPPDSYRGYEYQSSDGSKCVDAWFEGYPAGVAAAKKDNSGSFHDIAVSRLLEAAVKQEKTKPKVTGDVPVVSDKTLVNENRTTYRQSPPIVGRPEFPIHRSGLPAVLSADPNIDWKTTSPVVPAGFNPG